MLRSTLSAAMFALIDAQNTPFVEETTGDFEDFEEGLDFTSPPSAIPPANEVDVIEEKVAPVDPIQPVEPVDVAPVDPIDPVSPEEPSKQRRCSNQQ